MLAHLVGHEELGIFRPAVSALGETRLILAQRLTVRRRRVDLVRRTVTDVAIENDQGGSALSFPECRERTLDPLHVISIADAQHVPAISQEARCDILGEGDARIALD